MVGAVGVPGGGRFWRVRRDVARNRQRAGKLVQILGVPAYRRALRSGVAAAVEHERIPLPGEIATVLDIGANRGQFALVALRRFPRATLCCFEPLAGPAARLRALAAGEPRVTVHEVALGAECGQAAMHVTRDDDSSSLLSVTERQVATFPGTREVGMRVVTVRRLDDILDARAIERPALMKIDVQGYEVEVLCGASAALRSVDYLLAEASFVELYRGQPLASELIAVVAAAGFRLSGVYSPTYDAAGRCLQADLLFERCDGG
jgi:FkbM family methyltransferase